MKYKVIKEHWAGRKYAVGDIRQADPKDVAHLVGTRLKAVKPKKPEDDDS